MSDLGRKDLGEQAKEKVTPDCSKTTTEKATENVTGCGDKIASALQPDSEKSTAQSIGDSARSGTNEAQSQTAGIVNTVKEQVAGLTDAATEQIKKTADYVAGTTKTDDCSATKDCSSGTKSTCS